ncbi:MAG: DUF2927 domain-containing protein [Oscillospiraceae bacterium]|nr:DUF2927 domain-containing protein [Oscillospiraceae bacterium]
MKHLTKVLMLTAVFLMCLWGLSNPVQAYSEDDFTYQVANGVATITGTKTQLEGEVVLPSTIDGYQVAYLGGNAFAGQNITSLTIPESINGIAYTAFTGMDQLEAIWVDANNATYANDGCGVLFDKKLTSVFRAPSRLSGEYTLPETVTRIGNEGFIGCDQLCSITIPAKVTTICKDAFSGCTMLSDVYFGGTETQWAHITIDQGNEPLTAATVHCDENAVTITCELTKPAEGEVVPRKAYNVEGKIKSQFPLSYVEAYIDGECFVSITLGSVTTLDIKSSAINQKLSFSKLYPGQHTLEILAWDIYSDDPVTVCTRKFITEGVCEHNYVGEVTQIPTCIQPGTMTYTCSYCKATYTENLQVAHIYVDGRCSQCNRLQYDTQSAVTCSVTQPAEGASVPKASYNVVGQITSKYPLERVEAYLDGTCFAVIDMNGAKTLTIKSSAINKLKFANLAPGAHTMEIKVSDIYYGQPVTVCTRKFVTQGTVSCTHTYTKAPNPAATCTQDGVMKYTCSKCKIGYTVNMVAHHVYENGACTQCGLVKSYNLTLYRDTELHISLQQDLYVDLNGCNLIGTIVTNGYQIYGMDSTTNQYTCDRMGAFSCVDGSGKAVIPESGYTTSDAVRYLTIQTENGYTFHRFYLGITQMSLVPAATGFGYRAEFYGDEMVQAQIASVGYRLWLREGAEVSRTVPFQNCLTLRLNNYDVEGYGSTPVNACAVICLVEGTVLQSATASYSMRQMVEAINAEVHGYDTTVLNKVAQMIHANPIMESWSVANILNPQHSDWYIPGLSVEDVIRYYNEVALDAEYSSGSGNAKLVQKWDSPIYYMLEGSYTQADREIIQQFATFFNSMEGSPGMYATTSTTQRNLRICFTTQQGMVDTLGDNFAYADGGVTYWYDDNRIYTSTICVLKTLSGIQRTSVLLEELYNGTGLVQDTILREDSVIYSYSDSAQWLTDVDELLLKLLYHPQIRPGMNAAECEAVIRKLYY